MTVPANLVAAWYGRSVGHAVVSIATPLNGSTIPSNSMAEAISGTASSNAGNINSIQYQIDGGAWQTITITAAATVNYSGGNAGQIAVGNHVVTVKATDTAGNTSTVSSSYSIAGSPPATSYSWTPSDVYNGTSTYLSIVNAAKNAAVSFTQSQYDANSNIVLSGGPTTIGTTDSNGDFSYTGSVLWQTAAQTDIVQLSVGGSVVAAFTFYNFGNSPSYSYGPSVTPSGAITLSIANSWGSCVIGQTITYSPSGRVVGPTAIGSTSSIGNFSYGTTLSWGSDTSASIAVTMAGKLIGTFPFQP